MTGDSAGSADVSQKAPSQLPAKRRPMLKSPPSTRPKAVLKSAPSTLRAPPPVEKYVVPKGPAVVPVFNISDFPMTLPGLPSSIASSPATTLAPETPRAPIGQLPSTASSPKPMGPPPVQSSSPKPRAPSREQVQIEVDTILREIEKRAKRTADQQHLHAMRCCLPSSSQSLRIQFQTAQSGFIPQGRRTAWGVFFRRFLTLGHCRYGVQDDLMRVRDSPDHVAKIQDFWLRAHVPLLPHDCDEEEDAL